jgi:hypothetical protein
MPVEGTLLQQQRIKLISALVQLRNGIGFGVHPHHLAVPTGKPVGASRLEAGVANQGSDGESRFGHRPLQQRDDPREWPPNVDERKA